MSKTNVPANSDDRNPLPRWLCRGTLNLGGMSFDCFVTEGERRVLSPQHAMSALTGSVTENRNFARFFARIFNDLDGLEAEPFCTFRGPTGVIRGIPAEFLPKLCAAITDAALVGGIHASRAHIVANARKIEKALAGVGIVALVDEATGYQSKRAPDALARLFAEYLLVEPGVWARAIPEDLYVHLARLYRHAYTAGQARRPRFFRSWTWKYVYAFLPDDVRAELQARNPNPHAGSTKHHQHLTARVREVLTAHLIRLTAVVRGSTNPSDFHMRFNNEFKGGGLQLSFGDA